MKKVLKPASFFIILFFSILSLYLQFSPPLSHGFVGSTMDKESVIVSLVNNNILGKVRITNVKVNGKEPPVKMMMQVSHKDKGFSISDSYEEAYGMNNISDSSARHVRTIFLSSQKSQPEKIYGLSISQGKPINRIEVSYRYLGLSFVKTISL
ncbi:hypothetical protein LCL89_12475 [Halobacillus yeomjeoni]|uniref:hypothetical protein n=1 Tax=Halobacillus yeomjeoni TaxID=311194 RepID=UPI001CD22EEC|nr:hypothetical protein [Halobacillus yeomjeoni]MCA0984863.1 hypothetical protein [Halobacillus yeomjeoni]